MLLAVTEDRATLRSDPSAVYGFIKESDASASLFFLLQKTQLSLENQPSVKPRVSAAFANANAAETR